MSDDPSAPDPTRREAEVWISKLSRNSVSNDDLRAFFAWRRDPENRRVWDALAAGRKRVKRYVVRPETERFKVMDIWTGETAVIAMTPQDGMSEADAVHTARLLNGRSKGGDRSLLQ
jgi:hypothetical protein